MWISSYLPCKFCELYHSLWIWLWMFLVYLGIFFSQLVRIHFRYVGAFNIIVYFFFQDGPLRIEASTTGSMSTISKIIRMVCTMLSLFQQTNCEIIILWDTLANYIAFLNASNLEWHAVIIANRFYIRTAPLDILCFLLFLGRGSVLFFLDIL